MFIGKLYGDYNHLLFNNSFNSKYKTELYIGTKYILDKYDDYDITINNKCDVYFINGIEDRYSSVSDEDLLVKEFTEDVNSIVSRIIYDTILHDYKIKDISVDPIEYLKNIGDGFLFIIKNGDAIYLNQLDSDTILLINRNYARLFGTKQEILNNSIDALSNTITIDKTLINILIKYSGDTEYKYNDYIEEINNILQPDEINIYLLLTIKELLQRNKLSKKKINVWKDAYKVEDILSNKKIRINIDKIKNDYEQYYNNIIDSKNYDNKTNTIKIEYNGVDKVTGRLYQTDSIIPIQSFNRSILKELLLPFNVGDKIIQYDFNYFEFNILNQLLDNKLFNGDPHTFLAEYLFGDRKKRKIAKGINYSILYGKKKDNIITEFKLDDKASKLIDEFRNKITPIEIKLKKEYEEKGFITNHFGRNISPTKDYALLNNYIQSTAADFLIKKIIRIDKVTNKKNDLLFQNHDSLLFNISNNRIKENIEKILIKKEGKLKCGFSEDIIIS